jgi:glycosyltransferase involved in cell wall biosynthesis
MRNPSVSVIIAVKDSQNTIQRAIASVLASEYSPFDVIIVDDGSTDRTPDIIREFGDKVKIISHPTAKGPSFSRNEAVRASKSDLVAFTDGDCVAARDWLAELVKGLKGENVVSCGGIQLLPDDATSFERDVFAFMSRVGFITDYVKHGAGGGISAVGHNPSCTVIYKRDVFESAGGFFEGLWPGEDVELDHRLSLRGYRHMFNPKAVVYHYKPKSFKGFLSMMLRYGRAQGFLVRMHGFFRPVHAVPFLFVVFFLAGLWLMGTAPVVSAAVVIVLVLSGLAYFGAPRVLWLAFAGLVEWCEGFFIGLTSYRVLNRE